VIVASVERRAIARYQLLFAGARRPASDNLALVQAALEQARGFDRSGQEAQCIDAIEQAKRLVR
jgi:hypothetical protein